MHRARAWGAPSSSVLVKGALQLLGGMETAVDTVERGQEPSRFVL